MKRTSLYSLTLGQLREKFIQAGISKFSADQVYGHIYKRFELDMDKWSNVGKKTRLFISEHFDISLPKIVWHGHSKDGTRKFLLAMSDKKTVECVAIPAPGRLTLCVSSQVGCAIGCIFCHTGTMGLTRNLEAGEIVGQYLTVSLFLRKEEGEDTRLSNIVYMGQGEPLHNYLQVKNATLIFMEPMGLGLGQRKITLSTSGLVHQIENLWDFPPVNIAISLHAVHNEIRSELMPINIRFDLERLFMAIGKIPLKAHRRITYEYILIDQYNDRLEDIEGLAKLLKKTESKINLIPFNEYPESKFKRPSSKKVKWFMNQLLQRDYVCTVRATKGADILAACGQLKSKGENSLNLWQKP